MIVKSKKSKRRPKEHVRKAMRAVKGANTAPEIALRKALWAQGYRYRLHSKRLFGKPDLVFPSRRTVVFIDGDYWHGRQWLQRGFASLSAQMRRVNNAQYWIKKIQGNIDRDKLTNRELRRQGWKVIRIWESDLKKRPEKTIQKVIEKLK